MLRIGKFTLDGYENYGQRLQCFALQHYLEKYGEVVNTIWNNSETQICPQRTKWGWKQWVKLILDWKGYRSCRIEGNLIGCEAIRQYRIKRFNDEYICTDFNWVNTSLDNLNEKYDFFIIGSDQVWSPYVRATRDVMFLTFAPYDKRIAYAASFGVSEIPNKLKGIYAKWLNGIPAISVREKRGAEIIKELTGRDVPVLIDPTMLLTPEEWNHVARKPFWLQEDMRYILVYFLGEMPREARMAVQKLAEEKHLAVIDLMDWHNLNWYASDPAEFVYLIAHADLIYTDSFHGTVFSILYQRPFVICDRWTNNKHQCMNSRIDTLLNLFHFEERFGTEANHYTLQSPMHIEYSDVSGILNRERKRSADFLRRALHLSE